MIQGFESEHKDDSEGRPAGGWSIATGVQIRWQDGPLGRGDERIPPNGAFVETLIAIAKDRLEYYNKSEFKCRENSLAITKLEEALHWLQHRTADREQREVEGTHGL